MSNNLDFNIISNVPFVVVSKLSANEEIQKSPRGS